MPPLPQPLVTAEALEALRPAVFRICRSILRGGMIDGRDAEDLTQATLLKAWRHRAQFQGTSTLRTWLSRIAINESATFVRRHHPTLSLDCQHFVKGRNGDMAPWQPESNDPALDEWLSQRERLQRIDKAVQRLPEYMRLVFVMRYGPQQMDNGEIVREAGISEPALKSRLMRARRIVQRRLGVEVGRLRK